MQITKYNLSKPTKYTRDGEEKTRWESVGTYTEFEKDGKMSRIVEIPAIGLRAQAFSIDIAGQSSKGRLNAATDEVNPEDIPF